jgi:SH3-like domain-containing protein
MINALETITASDHLRTQQSILLQWFGLFRNAIKKLALLRNDSNLLLYSLLLFIIILAPILTEAKANRSVPRFASIKANEVNARNGPSTKSSIEWVFIKKGEPVEIIAEYDQWRQIRDIKGEGGWVHMSVLSGKRSVVVIGKGTVQLLKSPGKRGIVANVSAQVRCNFNKCKGAWCQVICKTYKGWLPKDAIWGVYTKE